MKIQNLLWDTKTEFLKNLHIVIFHRSTVHSDPK